MGAPTGLHAQASATGAVAAPSQSLDAPAGERVEGSRRNDPGALPRPLNIQMQGEGLRLPQGAETQLIVVDPGKAQENAPAAPADAPKAPAGQR